MLPGQIYSFKAVIEESSNFGIFDPASLISERIWFINSGISSFLSDNVGISMGKH